MSRDHIDDGLPAAVERTRGKAECAIVEQRAHVERRAFTAAGDFQPALDRLGAVNDLGQVVGNENDGFNEIIAALWSGGRGYDLNTLVAPNSLQMISADYINDHGDIVGHGVMPDGSQRMFLLLRNPSVPLPSATASVARAPRGQRSRHHTLTAVQDRWLVREFGSATRIGRRPAF